MNLKNLSGHWGAYLAMAVSVLMVVTGVTHCISDYVNGVSQMNEFLTCLTTVGGGTALGGLGLAHFQNAAAVNTNAAAVVQVAKTTDKIAKVTDVTPSGVVASATNPPIPAPAAKSA